MFRKSKDEPEENVKAADDQAPAEDPGTPPLKPFSRTASNTPSKTPATPFRPDIPRRPADPVGTAPAPEAKRTPDVEDKQLLVGRDIHLRGEITSCDKLVVEGRVEASLSDARVIDVAPSGYFKGNARVDEAIVSGLYEGELTALDTLTVRSGGRIQGSVRYGRIVIESGGEISGDMQTLTQADRDGTPRPAVQAAPAPTPTPAPSPAPAAAANETAVPAAETGPKGLV